MLGLFSLLGISVGLINDTRIHNQKYYGTKRDMFKGIDYREEQRREVEEIYEQQRRAYEARIGKR